MEEGVEGVAGITEEDPAGLDVGKPVPDFVTFCQTSLGDGVLPFLVER